MGKTILSEESARAQVAVFLDFYEISPEDVKNTEAKNGLDSTIEKLVKAIRAGHLEIGEDKLGLKVIQNLKCPMGESKTIEYSVLCGRHKVAMKDKNPNDFHGRIYSMMGSISGIGETGITALKGVDISIVECLGALFLNV